MRLAPAAQHLGAAHEPGIVRLLLDRARLDRLPEARPAGAALVLRLRAEERLAAADADIGAGRLRIGVLAGPRPLGPVLTGDLVLLRRQLRLPLGVALDDLLGHFSSNP